jgi:molybdopterin converting factor small subunit
MPAPLYDQLVTDSLHLSTTQRGELAAILLSSLEDDLPASQKRSPEEASDEITRRSDELHAGAATTLDATDSIALAKARLAELKQS